MSQPISLDSAAQPKTANRDDATRAVPNRRRQFSGSRSEPKAGERKPAATGDHLFGFELHQELGHGAFARVFLATQADLAGRSVVLKVSGLDGDEPQTLAQLQHTHIVPIHSVHEDRPTNLRAVCMPYFGGASLSAVLNALWADVRQPTQGEQLAKALAQVGGPPGNSAAAASAPELQTTAGSNTPLAHWSRLGYHQAAAWIVARLAEGLQHAHQRGVLHRDVKPSNILLGADGQPMLLDFNVSEQAQPDPDKDPGVLGGTVAYMAPEHLRALGAQNPTLSRQVDRRADIYSLGMVLYEILAGSNPFLQSSTYSPLQTRVQALAEERARAALSIRPKRPDVPWSLESIVRHCLAPDPAGRYQQAEHLAEDLRRFLENRPLKYAPELSQVERVRKWARRHPRLTSSASVAVAAALVLVAAGAAFFGVRDQLQGARAQERKRQYETGHVRALCLVNTTTDLPQHVRAGLDSHLGQGQALCEETLNFYGVLDRADWERDPLWRRLPDGERQQLAEDTRELLLLLASARVRSAPGNPEVLRDALALLDRAEAIRDLAPSQALLEDRTKYLDLLGDKAGAETVRQTAQKAPLTTARGYYLLAGSLARAGQYDRAVQALDEALRLNPRHYWSSVQRGICHQELGQPALAVADFSVCVGLWPEFAWGYFNRGYALEKSGHRREAIADYTAALERDPSFSLAHLNRGNLRLLLGQNEAALQDFHAAAELAGANAELAACQGVALEKLQRHAEADAAFQIAFARAGEVAEERRTSIALVYGCAVSERLPEKALQAFADVLSRHPQHPQALYSRAVILVGRRQEKEAVALFTQAIAADPNFVEPRRFRAILLARTGDLEGAMRDVNWCLEKEPRDGASHYAAACVASLAAEKAPDRAVARQNAEQALAFLRNAFAHNYGQDKAANDSDLTALRQNPKFDDLLKTTALTKAN